jgi:hypothetical protein
VLRSRADLLKILGFLLTASRYPGLFCLRVKFPGHSRINGNIPGLFWNKPKFLGRPCVRSGAHAGSPGELIRAGCGKQADLAGGDRASFPETRSSRTTFPFERAWPAPEAPTLLGTECHIDTRLVGQPCRDGAN